MRIKVACPTCAQEAGGLAVWHVETIREDGLYTGKCPKGHSMLLGTQTLQHEMLFDIALNAILDGYNREAVSSFAASMERFFEFAIFVIARRRSISDERLERGWKKVASQSERQLGAYIFLYLSEFGTIPELIDDKMTKLRNDVVHKGRLPSKEEATSFGCAVYVVIQEAVRQLRSTHLNELNAVLGERVNRVAEKMGTAYPRTFQVATTALNIIEDISCGYRPFEKILIARGIAR